MYRIIIRDLDDNEVVLKDEFDAFVLGAANEDEARGLSGFNKDTSASLCQSFSAALRVMAFKVKESPGMLLGMALARDDEDDEDDDDE